MGNQNEDSGMGFDVEREWLRVDKLLNQKSSTAWGMALLEAHKIFQEVLAEISYGETVFEQIHNAGELFTDINKLMQAEELYLKLIEEVDFAPSQAEATNATGIFLRSILDMTGRDFVNMGIWHRLNNSLNFFWGNHPKFLVYVLSGLLVFVGGVWVLDQTPVGKWVVGLAVGFSSFIVGNQPLLLGLLGFWAISAILSWVFFKRR